MASTQSALQKFINSPAGPKTIHFWAPAAKWALVIAGIKDLQRPADKLSLKQNLSLAATGIIWSRYSMVIIPKNYTLLTVNLFLSVTGSVQSFRAWRYQHQQKKLAQQKQQ